MAHVELARRAERDLKRLGAAERKLIRRALEGLVAGAENLDVKALTGRHPWMRARAGDYRILFRRLSESEVQAIGTLRGEGADQGVLVARVVNRAQLERAVATL